MVLGMGFEVFGKILNPLGYEGDLNFGGTGVTLLLFKILNQLGLLFFRHHGAAPQIKFFGSAPHRQAFVREDEGRVKDPSLGLFHPLKQGWTGGSF
jgi:hypothetical protein